jgi:hypothetical protein
VDEKSNDQHNLQRADHGVRSHEVRPVRKGLAIVVNKDHRIDAAMHNEEANQKQAGKRHQNFLSY